MNSINLPEIHAQYLHEVDKFRPVLMVSESRHNLRDVGAVQYDNTFDHFMYDHVGDAWDCTKAPTAIRSHETHGVIEYNSRMYLGYTQSGKMLVVRTSPAIDRNQPEAYYLVTADLVTGEVVPWFATKIIERRDDSLELDFCYIPNPSEQEDDLLGRLVLSTQKVELTMPGKRPERVPVAGVKFFELLDYQQKWLQAEALGKLMVLMTTQCAHGQTSHTSPATLV